jgi:hypothetical protein
MRGRSRRPVSELALDLLQRKDERNSAQGDLDRPSRHGGAQQVSEADTKRRPWSHGRENSSAKSPPVHCDRDHVLHNEDWKNDRQPAIGPIARANSGVLIMPTPAKPPFDNSSSSVVSSTVMAVGPLGAARKTPALASSIPPDAADPLRPGDRMMPRRMSPVDFFSVCPAADGSYLSGNRRDKKARNC